MTNDTATVELKRAPLFQLGSLSSVASLAAIIIALVTGTSKLNSIDNRSATNCQLLANGIVLTLEASKGRQHDPASRAFLSEQEAHFEKIAREC